MADGDRVAFAPLFASGKITDPITVTAGNVSPTASAQFPARSSNQMLIHNRTSVNAWIQIGKYGSVTTAAVDTGMMVLPMAGIAISAPGEMDGASVILEGASANGSSKVSFHLGSGV